MYRFMKILSFLVCHLPVSWQQALGRGMGVFFLDLCAQAAQGVGTKTNIGL